ncbi:hypothetical protein AYI68_g4534 [Smittium mucronatum]|uniref:Phosducin-like protein n=1 Tax=Smittium mucronatum TaxID=133383 RepID=A0A1R0GWT7_9FUNG|nr:hypothetical protein AYI68_g4534 [Smittium mucronatum]
MRVEANSYVEWRVVVNWHAKKQQEQRTPNSFELAGKGGGLRFTMDSKHISSEYSKLVSDSDNDPDEGISSPVMNVGKSIHQDYFDRQGGPNTGPKSVLADFNYKKRLEYENYLNSKNEESEYIKNRHLNYSVPNAPTIWAKEDSTRDSSDISDLEDIDDDVVFEEHEQGTLKLVSPTEYAETVEKYAASGSYVIVFLHMANLPISEKFKSELEKCAKRLSHIFLIVDAVECGFKDHEVLPILLIYKNGQLVANHVKVDSLLEPRFDHINIQKALLDSLP